MQLTKIACLTYSIPWFKHFSMDLPGGPVADTPCFQCRGPKFDPWLGNCREAAQVFPLMTRSWGRALMGKVNQGLRAPHPGSAWASTPKPESVCLPILWLSPISLTLMGGYPRPPFSEGNQLGTLVNKPPENNRIVLIQTPQMAF